MYVDSNVLDAGSVRCFEVIEHVLDKMYVPLITLGSALCAHVVVTLVGLLK